MTHQLRQRALVIGLVVVLGACVGYHCFFPRPADSRLPVLMPAGEAVPLPDDMRRKADLEVLRSGQDLTTMVRTVEVDADYYYVSYATLEVLSGRAPGGAVTVRISRKTGKVVGGWVTQ